MVFLLAQYHSGDHIGEDERGGVCSTNSIAEKFMQGLSERNGSKVGV